MVGGRRKSKGPGFFRAALVDPELRGKGQGGGRHETEDHSTKMCKINEDARLLISLNLTLTTLNTWLILRM